MSDIKYVIADDGERYPVREDAKFEMPAWINNNFEKNDVEEINLKVVSPERNMPVISEPDMFSDVRKRIITPFKKGKGFYSFILDVADEPLIWLVGLSMLAMAGVMLVMAKYILPFIILTATCISIVAAYFVNLLSLHRLKNYGFEKEQEVYVIDWRKEKIEKTNIQGVGYPYECMNDTFFRVKIEEDYNLEGKDIYFSQAEAEQMLLSVQSRNDYEISKYYPNWKADKDFYKFYLERVPEWRRYEKGSEMRNCVESLKEYIEEANKRVQRQREEEKEENALRDAMQKYSEGRL